MRKLRLPIISLLYICLLVGCTFLGLKEEKPFITSFPYPGPPEKIWAVIKDIFSNYRIKSIDYTTGTLETEWKTNLGIGLYESTRKKVHLQLTSLNSSPKQAVADLPGQEKAAKLEQYVVKVYVEVQCNKNMAPLDNPMLIQWKSAGSDSLEAEIIIYKLNLRLLDRETLERYQKGDFFKH